MPGLLLKLFIKIIYILIACLLGYLLYTVGSVFQQLDRMFNPDFIHIADEVGIHIALKLFGQVAGRYVKLLRQQL